MFTRITVTALALSLSLSAGAFAFERSGALGPTGEVYRARVAPYGLLFPKGNAYPAENSVLVLEVTRPGQMSADRLLVPGTEGVEVESSPFVTFEKASDSLYVVWQSEGAYHQDQLNLRTFKDGDFGPTLTVSALSQTLSRTAPQVAITRDEFFAPNADGVAVKVKRTFLHLVWWEESEPGSGKVVYAPLTLIDGVYTGWHPMYTLDEIDGAATDAVTASEVLPQLYRAPRIQAGRNDHSVVISFANGRNGRMTVFEASVLAGEISFLADGLRSHIIDIGRRNTPKVSAIADAVRSHIIDIGRLHPRVLAFLSNDLHAHILKVGPTYENDIPKLAEVVGAYVTQTASTFLENGLETNGDNPRILRLAQDGLEIGTPRLQIRRVFSRPAPGTAPAPTTVYSSKDGRAVLVAWETVNQIRYRESTEDGWGNTIVVQIGPDLTREQAAQFLEQRIRR